MKALADNESAYGSRLMCCRLMTVTLYVFVVGFATGVIVCDCVTSWR